MNSWTWSKPIGVMEINDSFTRAAHIRLRQKEPFVQILGQGEVPTIGMKNGRFLRFSDVTDSIWRAAHLAERESHAEVIRYTVALDDPRLVGARVKGSTYQDGSDEAFSQKHIEEARIKALQSIDPTDDFMVYQKEAGYLIDRTDFLHDPIGICGKELTIVLQLFFSNSVHFQNLSYLCERAGIELFRAFPSSLAALYGTLKPEKMNERNVLLLLQNHSAHLLHFERYAIQHLQSRSIPHGYREDEVRWMREFLSQMSLEGSSQVLATGELFAHHDSFEPILNELPIQPQIVNPASVGAPSDSPSQSVLMGLGFLSMSTEPKRERSLEWADWAKSAKDKAKAFIEEYF